ncbi:MAG TPA: hypothetical protein VJO99_07355, partial [Burkholderiaceae bacterium]|nr:hypothetical protein [Burkholderiaceae bacterium]
IAKTESEAYEAPRICMTRHDDARHRQDVDVYEMYWADLSRLSSALPRIVTELFTLIFRLSRLGRDTVDEASRAARTALAQKVQAIEARRAKQGSTRDGTPMRNDDDAAVRVARQAMVRWDRLTATQIALDWAFSALLTNLFVQLLIAGLFIAALGASRPYASVIHAVLAGAGPVLALWWISYRRALNWAGVVVWAVVLGGAAWLLLQAPPSWVIAPMYLGVLALLCDVCLRIADERFPATRRIGWFFLGGMCAFLTVYAVYDAWQGASSLENWLRASMRAVEYLLLGVVAWWGVVPLVMAVWLFNGRQAARGSDANSASVATGRLGMLVSIASFLAVAMTLWTLLRKLFEMGGLGVSYVPQVFTMAQGRTVDGAAFLAQRYTSSTESFALVGGACFLLILYLVVTMTPSVLAELKKTIGNAWTLGRWLSAGYRHLNGFVGLLAVLGVAAACAVGALLLMARFGVGQFHALAQVTEQVATASRTVLAPLVISAATAVAILSAFGKLLSRYLPGVRAPLDAALDVDNHFREFPRRAIPRARIFARYVSLLERIAAQNYDRVVIVAHSQGTVISTELLRYMKYRAAVQQRNGKTDDRILALWTRLNGKVHLLTAGCPLRQLYAARFPELYAWAVRDHGGLSGPKAAEVGVQRWINVYTTGDYVGRWLWCDPPPAVDTLANKATLFEEQRFSPSAATEVDVCLGAGAHTHYFEQHDARVVGWIDRLICAPAVATADQTFERGLPSPDGCAEPSAATACSTE